LLPARGQVLQKKTREMGNSISAVWKIKKSLAKAPQRSPDPAAAKFFSVQGGRVASWTDTK
jgi:hypothetical protein